MAKRSIQGYRPIAAADADRRGGRLFPDCAIEAMIAVAGEPPLGPFSISIVSDDHDEQVSGRAALQHHLENAAREFAMARQQQRKPTARQLEKKFSVIATAAQRLLTHLAVGPQHKIGDMPTSLLSGTLLAFAAKEAQKLDRSGSDLLQDAVQGVERIARWSNAARSHQEQIGKRRPMAQRNEGDRALDQFVGTVVATCWWAVYGRKISDGPKLIAFVQAAVRGVGEKPSADAVRERIRRVLRARGKSKPKQF